MLLQCPRCNGALLVRHDVFDPDTLVCVNCGREAGVELVRFMPDAADVMLRKGTLNAGGRHQCATCSAFLNRRRPTCIVCGDNNPYFQP